MTVNKKLLIGCLSALNAFFFVALFLPKGIQMSIYLYGIFSISLALIAWNNLKNKETLLAGLFFLAFILLSTHHFL